MPLLQEGCYTNNNHSVKEDKSTDIIKILRLKADSSSDLR